MSAVSAAVSAAMEQVASSAGVEIVYSRGAETVAVIAVPARTDVETVTEDGRTFRAFVRDYKIRAADLVLAGVRIEPQRDDQITEVRRDCVDIFRVMPIGGETAREATSAGDWVRVHTRRVGSQPVAGV